jgi:hypothetical protein
MKRSTFTTLIAACTLAASTAFVAVEAQQAKDDKQKAAPNMAEMMKRAERYTKPGKHHQALERFLGKWDTETRVFMGGQGTPPEKGNSEFAWLMEGRWLKGDWRSTMMGMPLQGFLLMGYDNFKQSYVTTQITSLDTAMTHAEGDMDPDGKALLSYGTLDEYLTGEHDKMVKYVWRFPAPDKMALEIHDLPIGERNTKVMEITYTRAP